MRPILAARELEALTKPPGRRGQSRGLSELLDDEGAPPGKPGHIQPSRQTHETASSQRCGRGGSGQRRGQCGCSGCAADSGLEIIAGKEEPGEQGRKRAAERRLAFGQRDLEALPEGRCRSSNTLSKSSRVSCLVLCIWPMRIRLNTISPKSPVERHSPALEHVLRHVAVLLQRSSREWLRTMCWPVKCRSASRGASSSSGFFFLRLAGLLGAHRIVRCGRS